MNQTEILAPAGSFESMKAAYKAGADAVYIGGMLFGARAYADNADTKEMLQAIDYSHLHHRKLYLTVNTLLKNSEIEKQLYNYLHPYYEQGLDAVIVQDLGVLHWIHDHFPDLPIHASTQMTVCGANYGSWLGERGVTRIVTPRELNIHEITEMKQGTGLEIETFVHGALCYCYSGQCLMSSMLGGRSGNRGRCAQPCRLPYSFKQKTGSVAGYLLSPKDLYSLDSLPELIDAGVDSLKIEGRMKKPEYAALTASLYRKYTDLYLEKGRENYRVQASDKEQLLELYNRGGFTNGYFRQHNGPQMMSVDRPNHSGIMIGTAKMQSKNQLVIENDQALFKGDVLELPDGSSLKLEKDIPSGKKTVQKYIGRPFHGKLPVIRTRNERLIAQITETFVKDSELKEKIYGSVNISKDLPAKIEVHDDCHFVCLEGETAEGAKNHPLLAEDIRKRLQKTGQTPFEFEQLDVHVSDDCYMSIQALNQLRRKALDQLESKCLEDFRRHDGKAASDSPPIQTRKCAAKPSVHVMISDLQQLEALLDMPEITRFYINDENHDEQIIRAAQMIHAKGGHCYLALPYIMRSETVEKYRQRKILSDTSVIDGFLVRNAESAFLLRSLGVTQPCIGDYNLYCMNDYANNVYLQFLDETTLPLELNRRELSELKNTSQSEMIIYGYMPLMVSAQCLTKNTGKCTHTPAIYHLEDRKHKQFPVKNVCAFCYNMIYNSVPLYLMDAVTDNRSDIHPGSVRIQFLNESPAMAAKITRAFLTAISSGESTTPVIKDYTKGHYQRGIE